MKSLVGQQVGFKLKRKRCVKSAVPACKHKDNFSPCYVLLTVFIVCLGSIKDIVFIVVSSDFFLIF